MTEMDLSDHDVEAVMDCINEHSGIYTAEGVEAEPPAIGAVHLHPRGSDPMNEAWVDSAMEHYCPDDLRYEVNYLGPRTVEVQIYDR